jgi:hypothetical protein
MITDYQSLQEAVNKELWERDDLDVPLLIQLAEANLRRDLRIRKLRTATLPLTGESMALPDDVLQVESLELTGPTYYGQLTLVSYADIHELRGRRAGTAGIPCYYTTVDSRLYVAPAPSFDASLNMVYMATVPHLSDTATTNWLLLEEPDLYLYATLLESAPYLKEDDRMGVWGSQLEERLTKFHITNRARRMSSNARRRSRRTIGG